MTHKAVFLPSAVTEDGTEQTIVKQAHVFSINSQRRDLLLQMAGMLAKWAEPFSEMSALNMDRRRSRCYTSALMLDYIGQRHHWAGKSHNNDSELNVVHNQQLDQEGDQCLRINI